LFPDVAPDVVDPVLDPRTRPTAESADDAAEVERSTMFGTWTPEPDEAKYPIDLKTSSLLRL
jgi:hypothetical protein